MANNDFVINSAHLLCIRDPELHNQMMAIIGEHLHQHRTECFSGAYDRAAVIGELNMGVVRSFVLSVGGREVLSSQRVAVIPSHHTVLCQAQEPCFAYVEKMMSASFQGLCREALLQSALEVVVWYFLIYDNRKEIEGNEDRDIIWIDSSFGRSRCFLFDPLQSTVLEY